ncbi:glycerophosphodiester phosphodiesterase family protein [Fulvivirgaceae bacterium BMA10]|uniref:Glycerophosphodiester phosphodiesterase family protein n=1 Tax=Splendidivirga corallicola TaxID=3051826 RepID=A0ABT8KLA8_9BACT|nr:glycerophosphodiester phosphodiesterase family protein [Fulvivirgaceae bacterium BMA10]
MEIQGHRGARGLSPENTIVAFEKAVDLGVGVLELDVVITKDKQVVISHEAYMSSAICKTPDNKTIEHSEEKKHNIYQMTYEEVSGYDCGSIGNERFPEQEKQKVSKPLLKDMIKAIEERITANNLPKVKYNIEIKSSHKGDEIFHPKPEEFSDLVYEQIKALLPMDRVVIQSFDLRILKYFHEKYPDVTLSVLVEKKMGFNNIFKELGFTPEIFSPYYRHISAKVVKKIQDQGVKVIPWTVNEENEMKLMQEWGVDGLITDYPDRALNLK